MALIPLGILSAAGAGGVAPTKPVVTGGTLSSDATFFYRAFTGNGDLVVSVANLVADILVIGGGASGGVYYGGGGGAGGVSYLVSKTITPSTNAVVIGAGGAGIAALSPAQGNNGIASTFLGITSNGGGGGGRFVPGISSSDGSVGGSGGGGAMGFTNGSTTNAGAANQGSTGGATGYGQNGGAGYRGNVSSSFRGGGGGGAGAQGTSTPINNDIVPGSDGGAGLNTWSDWLTATGLGVGGFIAGGGGGSSDGATAGAGGSGGGGRGAQNVVGAQFGVAGATNTGSGGGADGAYGIAGSGAGGSGLVIIRYLKSAV